MSEAPLILMTGATGLIGTALQPLLRNAGYELLCTTRFPAQHPNREGIRFIGSGDPLPASTPVYGVINLAGEPLANTRWNHRKKQRFIHSRVGTTDWLFNQCAYLDTPPAVVLSGSAIGYYGVQHDQRLFEGAGATGGFSHRLCQDWEQSALQFKSLGSRVCVLRTGIVLDTNKGALPKLKQSLSLKLACQIGAGRQYMSWIHIQDVVAAILFLLSQSHAHGAFNLTAPNPVTNREFACCLAEVGDAIGVLRVPALMLRLVYGEMANELLIGGQRVIPKALCDLGYEFHYAELEAALRDLA